MEGREAADAPDYERGGQESLSGAPFRRYVPRYDILRQPRVIKPRLYRKGAGEGGGRGEGGELAREDGAGDRDGAKLSRVAVRGGRLGRRRRWMRSVCYAVGIKQCLSSRDAADDAVSPLAALPSLLRKEKEAKWLCLRQIARTDMCIYIYKI